MIRQAADVVAALVLIPTGEDAEHADDDGPTARGRAKITARGKYWADHLRDRLFAQALLAAVLLHWEHRRPPRALRTVFLRTFVPWQIVGFAVINLKMFRLIWRSH